MIYSILIVKMFGTNIHTQEGLSLCIAPGTAKLFQLSVKLVFVIVC